MNHQKIFISELRRTKHSCDYRATTRSENEDFIQNSPEKQLSCNTPPIQFIPSPLPKARTSDNKFQLKITFPSKVVKTYRVFFAGDLEQAINQILVVWSIVEDKQIKLNILAAKTQII